jgi:hypothetical protein
MTVSTSTSAHKVPNISLPVFNKIEKSPKLGNFQSEVKFLC